MVTNRMHKFDELILRKISEIIGRHFPDRFFSVTQVHVSKDLSFAKVWISSTEDMDQFVKELRSQSKAIRFELSKEVIARKIPNLYFVTDTTEQEASKIERLLQDIKSEEKK